MGVSWRSQGFVAAAILAPGAALVALMMTPTGAVTFTQPAAHIALIGLANIVMAGFGLLALVTFVQSGRTRDLALAAAFLSFAAVYVWHGVYTDRKPDFVWLIYGPASRVFFAAFLVGVAASGRVPAARRLGAAAVVAVAAAALALLAGSLQPVLAAFAADSGAATINQVRLTFEAMAITLLAVAFWRSVRAGPQTVPVLALVGCGVIAYQSLCFVAGAKWNVIWWVAHGLGAAGTTTMALAVLVLTRVSHRQRVLDDLTREIALRQTFVRAAAHAIRTPLTSLRLNVHVMRQKAQEKDAKRLAAMDRALDEIGSVEATLMEETSAELGALGAFEPTDVDVASLVTTALKATPRDGPQAAPQMKAPAPPLTAFVDGRATQEALTHLFSHARPAGPDAEPTARVERVGPLVRCTVDGLTWGTTLPADARAAATGIQAGYVHSTEDAATALARAIIKAQGGSMTVRAPAKGRQASLVIDLPAAAAQGQHASRVDQAPGIALEEHGDPGGGRAAR